MTIRVLLADDQEMVRDGLAAVLASSGEIEVVGQASNGVEAVEQSVALHPDVVVMDIRMPRMDGLAATRIIAEARMIAGTAESPFGATDPGAGPRVLVLTTFDLDEYVYEALGAGASGFLLKDAPAADLVAAVKVVARGEALLAPSVTRRLIADVARRRRAHVPANHAAVAALTPREVDVLRLVARGLSNAEIADELVLAEQTVKTHVGRVLLKVGLRDRTQAVVLAYENGLAGS